MIAYILSLSLLLNIYSLPVPIERAPDYQKKMEVVEQNADLKRINSRFFNREPVTFKQLMPGEDLAEAGKGSTIYFAYANDGAPIAIIKKLPMEDSYDRAEMKDEVSSLHEQFFRNKKNFKVPRLIGTVEFTSETERSAYIIETVAQGKSINALIKEAASTTGDKHFRAMRTLREAVENTAKSFAEFHNIKHYKTYSHKYDETYAPVKNGDFKGPYGIIHGDAHLGNIFYNPKTHKTTFIDLSFMPRSLAGAPVGLDSGKFIFTLEGLCAFYGFNNQDTQELVNVYTSTYLAANPKMDKGMIDEYTMIAYKDFAYPSEEFLSDSTDQGSFLYRHAMKKVEEHA
jgi:hypothetical protein